MGLEAFLLFDSEDNSLATGPSVETMCIQLGHTSCSVRLLPATVQSWKTRPLTATYFTYSPSSAAGKQSTKSPGLPRYPTSTSTLPIPQTRRKKQRNCPTPPCPSS